MAHLLFSGTIDILVLPMSSKGPFSDKSRPVAAPIIEHHNYSRKTDRQAWDKTSMEKAIGVSTWLKSHPGRVCTHFQIGALLNKAYGKAETVQTSVNGFQKTGLWPVDPNVFPDYLFEPSETTNIPMRQYRIEPEEDSTEAKNIAGPSQVAESSSTSMIIASTSAADNPRPLSAAQSKNIVTAIPTTPTSSKMIL
ncbi:hypothetical protein WA026_001154 [Henosepilachna vigintioctopunctata]|uniref:Uncharacterized protein n=1 Tax=Henosepilachna vigintioctopunctata TaxID=420089 RepID=A0AAW1VA74_9CUCU